MSDDNKRQTDDDLEEMEGEGGVDRANWGNPVQFLLTMIGYAVGLGNVWRFPYLTYKNGGGAFVLPFVIMLLLVGIPLSYLEMGFGQFASLGPCTAYGSVSPLFKGVGFAMVITNCIISLYYNVIISWSFFYFFASMTNKLPWTDCENPWNDEVCFVSEFLKNNCTLDRTPSVPLYTCNDTSYANGTFQINATDVESPSEQYYYKYVLQISEGIEDLGSIRWQLACTLLICWVCAWGVLLKGISSLGKVVYFTTSFPYILLTIMLVRGVTLPNAAEGIKYYLIPDWSRLADVEVWKDAASQIFFALNACTGGLIAMSSFNKFKHPVKRDAIFLPVINVITSIYAGFVIFSVLGFMAYEKGVEVADVADEGPGLVFVVYPEALTQMPFPPLWSILFFFMLMTLGFSSEFSMVECTMATIIDEVPSLRATPQRNIAFRAVMAMLLYLISLPMITQGGFYIFSIADSYVAWPLLFIAVFELLVLMYVYDFHKFSEDMAIMVGTKPGLFFRITWCFVAPIILVFIILLLIIQYEVFTLFDGEYVYPPGGMAFAWVVVVLPLSFIPGVFFFKYCTGGAWTVMKDVSKPLDNWGPADKCDRTGRYKMRDFQLKEMIEMRLATEVKEGMLKKASYAAFTAMQQPVSSTIMGDNKVSPQGIMSELPAYNGQSERSSESTPSFNAKASPRDSPEGSTAAEVNSHATVEPAANNNVHVTRDSSEGSTVADVNNHVEVNNHAEPTNSHGVAENSAGNMNDAFEAEPKENDAEINERF